MEGGDGIQFCVPKSSVRPGSAETSSFFCPAAQVPRIASPLANKALSAQFSALMAHAFAARAGAGHSGAMLNSA
jgi:hypothetical protein